MNRKRLFHARFYKLHEQWVWRGNGTLQFWMELHPHKERMRGDFNNLGQARFWVGAGDAHARVLNLLFVLVIELIAVTVSFAD